MWCIRRIEPFSSIFSGKYIALVGSGGKTTLMEYLAAQAARAGRSVAITTTTRILAAEPYTLIGEHSCEPVPPGTITRVGKAAEGGKLTGLDQDDLLFLGQSYDRVVIEADGSRGMPLKYPSDYEPVIPPFCDMVVVVAGLDGLGGRVDERVFRSELFFRISGVDGSTLVTPEVMVRLFADDGVFKGVERSKAMVLLNKYDACAHKPEALAVARELIALGRTRKVVVSSLRYQIFYGVDAGYASS